MADAAETHSVTGVVITSDGTPISAFAVAVRESTRAPGLMLRKHFTHGEFRIDGLKSGHYELYISSPLYVPLRMDLTLTSGVQDSDGRIAILHAYRNEGPSIPVYTVSAKRLQQRIPAAARNAYLKAAQYHHDGQLVQALIEYGAAIRMYPEYVEALTDLGAILVLCNSPDAAMPFLNRAHHIDDGDPIININIAIAKVEQADYEAAMKLLRKVIEDNPRLGFAQYYVARIQFIQGRYGEAARSAAEAVAADPDLLEGWILLMQANEELKNRAAVRAALTHLRDAVNDKGISGFFDDQIKLWAEAHT